MPGIDEQSDLQIAAIALLARGAVIAPSNLGAGAVVKLYEEPAELAILGQQLPALCVYRVSDSTRRLSGTEQLETVLVHVEYVLPPTQVHNDQRKKRWPSLRKAWEAIRSALADGHHPEVEDDDPIIETADINIDDESFKALTYGLMEGGGQTFPWFRASFEYEHVIDGTVNATLVNYLRHKTIFDWNEEVSPTAPELRTENNTTLHGTWPDGTVVP